MSNEPRSKPKVMDLPRLFERYGSEEKALGLLTELRWPDGVVCPRDGKKASWIESVKVWDCSTCGYQFTVRVGTIFQDSKLPLWKWMVATFLMVESRKGISANQIRRMTGMTYKTAWFLTHRIREAMSRAGNQTPLTGTVEVDETYIGGRPRHPRHGRGRGPITRKSKTTVFGAIARGGEIRLAVERRDVNMGTARQFIAKNVDGAAGAIYTDSHPAYVGIGDADTTHASVSHRIEEWVRGDVHTNTIESAWSLFKRSILGSYHHLSAKHMDAYLDEFEWRFNNRRNPYLFRDTLIALLKSDNMTYKALIQRPA